jgi:hypothetical protein
MYIGIDNTVRKGNSRSTLDNGQTWRTDKLNAVDAAGEYMIRLLLAPTETNEVTSSWTPATTADPNALIGYVAGDNGTVDLEIDEARIDRTKPWRVEVSYEGAAPQLHWYNAQQQQIATESLPTATNANASRRLC